MTADRPAETAALDRIAAALARDGALAALSVATAALEGQPDSPRLARRRAALLRQLGRAAEARPILQALHAAEPRDVGVVLDLVLVLRALPDLPAAEALLAARLAAQPDNEWLLSARIEVAQAAGDTALALARSAAALDVRPDSRALQRKRALVLRGAGDAAGAAALLETLLAEDPDDSASALELAAAHRALGQADAAAALADRLLQADPTQEAALALRIDLHLDRDAGTAALALADAALARNPGSAALLRRRATALRRTGQAAAARALQEDLLAQAPQDVSLILELGLTLRLMGDRAAAEALFARSIAAQPGNAWLRAGQIELALAAGDAAAALERAAAAVAELPASTVLQRKHAAALRQAGRVAQAAAVLAALPPDPDTLLELGTLWRELGRLSEAEAALRQAAATATDPWPAREALAGVLDAQGRLADACATLSAPGAPPAAEVTRLALLLRAGDADGAARLAATLQAGRATLTEDGLARLMRHAEAGGMLSLLPDLVEETMGRRDIPLSLAQTALQIAQRTATPAQAAQIAARLQERVATTAARDFAVEAALALEGPFAALEVLRAAGRRAGTPHDTALTARCLLAAGRGALALRYLSRGLRRWPGAPGLWAPFVAACIATDQADRAHRWIAALAEQVDAHRCDALRLMVHVATDDLPAALAIVEAEVAAGHRPPGSDQHLRLLLGLGRLAEAEAAMAALRRDPATGRGRMAHAGTSLTGALLTELRLFHVARQEDARAAGPATHFHAAREVVAAWRPPATPRPAPEVPRRILQYWHDAAVPPGIARVMASWQGVPGWDRQLFHRDSALRWLGTHLGTDHARAFRLARHPAEEADFLRLCLLLHGGGVWADADDLRLAPPERLLAEGPGLIAFRETFGAVANNLLCAPPGHPVIGRAVQMARDALLRRDGDSVWMKTGPGLLTRALAAELAAGDPVVTLLPQIRAGRHVKMHVPMPYKTTGGYWDGGRGQDRQARGGIAVLLPVPDAAVAARPAG